MSDVLANAAFYYGIVRALADTERPVWTRMSFAAAAENLVEGAMHGIDARMYWPGVGEIPVSELVLRRLLPQAWEGLRQWGVSTADADRMLGIIEQRCLSGRTGATWQVETVHNLDHGHLDRRTALRPDDPGLYRANGHKPARARLACALARPVGQAPAGAGIDHAG